MSERIPLNPHVLKWARETAGWSLDDVATKMSKDVNTVSDWETGRASPTYIQLEKLAYQLFKRPIALFFFPTPPEEEPPKQSFRTLPRREIHRFSPRLRFLIRHAQAMQINLAELNDNINPSVRQIVRDLRFSPDSTIREMAAAVRAYLDLPLTDQFNWPDAHEAFKTWREILEKHGLFIFKEAFKEDRFSGFCLYDPIFPVIYVNNSNPDVRQVFTLFHELGHLLLGTGGIDARQDSYISDLRGDARKIEILCNSFVGGFLVPDDDFIGRAPRRAIDEKAIDDLSKLYKVSREVILRKFLDHGFIDERYYQEMTARWARHAPKRSGAGGDYYRTKGTYLGQRYLELAFSRYYQRKISIDQLANYLGVKVKNITGMESTKSLSG
jgi:Zn-dependent peptidase ImmA (M78 family)